MTKDFKIFVIAVAIFLLSIVFSLASFAVGRYVPAYTGLCPGSNVNLYLDQTACTSELGPIRGFPVGYYGKINYSKTTVDPSNEADFSEEADYSKFIINTIIWAVVIGLLGAVVVGLKRNSNKRKIRK